MGTLSSRTANEQSHYGSSALIKMFNGSKADVPVSYNAKEVMAHLRVSVYGEWEFVRHLPANTGVSRVATEVDRDLQ